jgi:hypothetical protein
VESVTRLNLAQNTRKMSALRLPQNKFDLDAVSTLQTVGYPDIAPLLDDLVDWIADGNWPVAKPLADLLVSIGPPAIPALRRVLQGADAIHQYFSLLLVVTRLSPEIIVLLRSDLKRIVDAPTAVQIREGVSELAGEILHEFDRGRSTEQS